MRHMCLYTALQAPIASAGTARYVFLTNRSTPMSRSCLAILAVSAAIRCIGARALHSAAGGDWQHAGGADQRADVASVHLAHKLHVAPAHAPGNVTRKPIAKLVARILRSIGVPTAATGRSRTTVAGLSAATLPVTKLLAEVPLLTQPPNQHSCWAYSRAVAIGFAGLTDAFLIGGTSHGSQNTTSCGSTRQAEGLTANGRSQITYFGTMAASPTCSTMMAAAAAAIGA